MREVGARKTVDDTSGTQQNRQGLVLFVASPRPGRTLLDQNQTNGGKTSDLRKYCRNPFGSWRVFPCVALVGESDSGGNGEIRWGGQCDGIGGGIAAEYAGCGIYEPAEVGGSAEVF